MMDFQSDLIGRNLPLLFSATITTIAITLAAFAVALLIAIGVGMVRRYYQQGIVSVILCIYIEIFRGTPLLVQLFFIYYGLPSVGIILDAFTAGVIGLALNCGAYMSETIRAAMTSVSRGQEEAAYSLGFSRFQTIRYIVFPQAIRVAIPPMMNSFSSLLKDSSLVSVISITELTRVGNLIYSRTSRPFEIYLILGIFYFVMTFSVTLISRYLEKRSSRWVR
ncbi:amino acid ABC transporter permease [uncultured Methanospirillum sp.]|uniref:amino acid ABC transporter permease n=1 Tax=uncultured Methanospirillum sp. TaxID=262503 RepID=UPI0029C78A65|nr:amino acid ABC transporter permease [uncultured Methanospirillum sp.]